MTSRLDSALVRRGLVPSRTKAVLLVQAGRVRVAGQVVQKASFPVPDDSAVEVLAGDDYVSRAAIKLRGALSALGGDMPTVAGLRCLDVGASTGGFTEVLLRSGAEHVIALDVGHDQLAPPLRTDSRVTVMEGYNARDLVVESLPWRPDLVVADVSFISLTLLLPALRRVSSPTTTLLLMVKPQFEVGRERLGAGGVVRDPALRVQAVINVAEAAHREGLLMRGVCASSLPGPHGNVEYFLLLTVGTQQIPALSDAQHQDIHRAVVAVPQFTTQTAGSQQ